MLFKRAFERCIFLIWKLKVGISKVIPSSSIYFVGVDTGFNGDGRVVGNTRQLKADRYD
jgi:hypothetical protein